MTDFEHPSIVLCPQGPMLLRGDHEVMDSEGNPHHTVRPVSAVCMCGGSAIKPWCDGTHRLLADRARTHKPSDR
ncbi:iron-binding CDGSH zinc finger protein [Nocardioides albertanoniae]|uniref:Iron-binding CDGSH zinc finger protein n=1 Tax=Nocardioides albertanoniae TaxID=1175486 RepID=A0A543A8K2_9ACTN|nr:CDGSH iron-sulfur domain-containing protein [Nocardioides albertanoniae]TQL68931.1 iron-binding CDGSH zinc finger protein [Nocardioides albertanoniae]